MLYDMQIYNYNWLVVEPTPVKRDGVRQWGRDYPIYEMENNPNVWNHQPDNCWAHGDCDILCYYSGPDW